MAHLKLRGQGCITLQIADPQSKRAIMLVGITACFKALACFLIPTVMLRGYLEAALVWLGLCLKESLPEAPIGQLLLCKHERTDESIQTSTDCSEPTTCHRVKQ